MAKPDPLPAADVLAAGFDCYVYLLRFHALPAAIKVGYTDRLVGRLVELTAAYGPVDMAGSVVVATASKAEARRLERVLLSLHDHQIIRLPAPYDGRPGAGEWMRAGARGPVLASVAHWQATRAGRGWVLPLSEVLFVLVGHDGTEKPLPGPAEERRRRRRRREAAEEAARRKKNQLNLRECTAAIEAHLPWLQRVTLTHTPAPGPGVGTAILEAELRFTLGLSGRGSTPPYDVDALEKRLRAHASLSLWSRGYAGLHMASALNRRESTPAPTPPLAPGATVTVPASMPTTRELVLTSRVPLDFLHDQGRRDTPEAEAWLRQLEGWRERVGGGVTPSAAPAA